MAERRGWPRPGREQASEGTRANQREATAERHRVFTDLFRLSTYLIPRSALPPLPATIARGMGFVYAQEG